MTLQHLKLTALAAILMMQGAFSQHKLAAINGHSHNDYAQLIPLLTAYYAGMGSIEADIYLRNGKLMVAHDSKEISPVRTLRKMYIEPLAEKFLANGNKAYNTSSQHLQLMIDLKENYMQLLPVLAKELKGYEKIFDANANPNAIKIVLSGNTPPAEEYKNYPQMFFFDGRPGINYTPGQLARVGLISADIQDYASWNGKGTPTPPDMAKMKAAISAAHTLGKPFRFSGTKDSPNSWKELEAVGVDWLGTDHPQALSDYFINRNKLEYTNPAPYQPYQPTYKSDGLTKKAKNVILLIGDGMGLAQIQAGLSANNASLNIIRMQYLGLSRTEAVNSDFTDSAAGGSAIAMGTKTNNRYVGIDAEGKKVRSIPDTLARHGIRSGIISSGDITDATPAVFYAHQIDRSKSFDIAADFARSNVDILVGSNRRAFTENPDKSLLTRIADKGYTLTTSLNDFEKQTNGRQLVLVDDSVTRRVLDGRGPMLKRSLSKTIDLLSANKKGFFIMAEGAQIDYGGHANSLPYMVSELHDFDKVVGEALRFADMNGETLVIVTADHETGGLSLLDANYRKGSVRGNFSSDDHTNIMVPVFAYGPGAANFIGVYNNTDLFLKILKAFKLD